MKEADRTTLFLKFAKVYLRHTFAAEMKISKEDRIPFDALKEHQERALLLAKHGVMNHKIADGSMQQTPFDCFQLSGVPAYVVIFWYLKPRDKRVTVIDIDDFVAARQSSEWKSLTIDEAAAIGKVYVL